MTESKSMLDWALFYAQQMGFRVLPLVERGKLPLGGTNGYKTATTDKETICKWWTEHPQANIGIATGLQPDGSFLTVIDIDFDEEKGKNGLLSITEWEDNNEILPDTLTAKTGRGGIHCYYKTSEAYPNRVRLLPDVDVRGEGGHIVAPPSVHPNGNIYKWDGYPSAETIQQANDTVKKLLAVKSPAVKQPKQSKSQQEKPTQGKAEPKDLLPLQTVTEGLRNDSLYRHGCSLQARGYSDEAIFQQLVSMNTEVCSPPLDMGEVERTYRSILTRPKGRPRSVEAAGDFMEYSEKLTKDYPFIFAKENKDGTISYSVNTPLLAEYTKQHLNYFFLDTAGNKPVIFLYSDRGVYKLCPEDVFKGHIAKPVEEFDVTLAVPRVAEEAYKKVIADTDKSRRVSAKQLDSDRNIINFKNGLLHLDTMELRPHEPKIYSTIQIPCDWIGGEAVKDCPVFTDFLNTITSGDNEAIELLWQWIGLTISNIPGYKSKAALFLCGAGNTGKSQFLKLLEKLVGTENYSSTDIKTLEQRFGVSAIWRKRLVGSPDMSFAKVDEIKMFKQLTGGDEIAIEYKGKDFFTDIYNGVLVFCCNKMPRFGGDKGDHVYERMIILPCNNVVPEEKRDSDLIDKLCAERDRIVYNAVMALKRLIENGYSFKLPDVCLTQREQYKTENDNVRQFINECTMPRQAAGGSAVYKDPCTTGNIYQAYCRWCEENGEYKYSNREFRQSICLQFGVDNPAKLETKQQGNRYYSFTLNEIGRKKIGYN